MADSDLSHYEGWLVQETSAPKITGLLCRPSVGKFLAGRKSKGLHYGPEGNSECNCQCCDLRYCKILQKDGLTSHKENKIERRQMQRSMQKHAKTIKVLEKPLKHHETTEHTEQYKAVLCHATIATAAARPRNL